MCDKLAEKYGEDVFESLHRPERKAHLVVLTTWKHQETRKRRPIVKRSRARRHKNKRTRKPTGAGTVSSREAYRTAGGDSTGY